MVIEKKLKHDIFEDELDGNAFAIMGAFSHQAKKEGWTKEEIDAVRKQATSGDYDHLIQTYMAHIE